MQDLVRDLRELREQAGRPALEAVVSRASQRRLKISRGTVGNLLAGKRVRWDSVEAFVVGCLHYASTRHQPCTIKPGLSNLEAWRARYTAAYSSRPSAPVSAPTVSAHIAGNQIDRDQPGRPLQEVTDPFDYEVHHAIDASGADLPLLPSYVRRDHDRLLEATVCRAADGASEIAVLVGGSSTGKTRACWEALEPLREAGGWRLWHPHDPTPPEAALADLAQVGPRTVVWLNETQFYLHTQDDTGPRVAAALRSLLTDPARAPVLVLGTLWPLHWDTLTRPPTDTAAGDDRHAAARMLLTGTEIPVPAAFTGQALTDLRAAASGDRRLQQAAELAEDGQVTQHLAGVPELLARYRNAPPAAKSLIHAAMDARRLGHRRALPLQMLATAAPAYLTRHEWDTLPDDWLETALDYTAAPFRGVRGPLTRIRPRTLPTDSPTDPAGGRQLGPHYLLADYLEQFGRHDRGGVYPRESLWDALATTVTDPGLLRHLGHEARWRGRYQRAIWFYAQAADRGDTDAWWLLVSLRDSAGDLDGAEILARQGAGRGATAALRNLASRRRDVGDVASARALTQEAAELGDVEALADLGRLAEKYDQAGAADLYRQAADRGNARALLDLALLRDRDGDHAEAAALAMQAVGRDVSYALWHLGLAREHAQDYAGAEEMFRRAYDHGDVHGLFCLAVMLEEAYQDPRVAEEVLRQAADRGSVEALVTLADRADQAGEADAAVSLALRAVERGYLDALRELAATRESTDPDGARALLWQAVHRGGSSALWDLARLQEATDPCEAEALYIQAAKDGCLDAWLDLARLREEAEGSAAAESVYLDAIDYGSTKALEHLARRWEQAGATADAGRLRRFGLTEARQVAASLDFGLYGGLISA